MRRLLCMVLTGAVMIGCLCTGAALLTNQMSFHIPLKDGNGHHTGNRKLRLDYRGKWHGVSGYKFHNVGW